MVNAYREARYVLCDDNSIWAEQEDQTLEQLWDIGFTVTAHQLGKCWRDGLGVLPDGEKAELWFQRSVEAGNDFSQYALGKLLQDQKRITEAVKYYEQAASQGNQYASCRLGKLHLQGEGVSKDEVKAVNYLTQAATSGNQYAQYALGKLYLDRQGGEETYYFHTIRCTGKRVRSVFPGPLGQPETTSVMLSVTRLLHHMSEIFQDNSIPPQALAGQQVDRKLQLKIREKKIAMGHKPDHHPDVGMTIEE